jgi:hypothetical protein
MSDLKQFIARSCYYIPSLLLNLIFRCFSQVGYSIPYWAGEGYGIFMNVYEHMNDMNTAVVSFALFTQLFVGV